MPADLRFHRAEAGDAPRVLSIVQEAARWLASRGIRQWNWYLTEAGERSIPERIAMHESYLVTSDGIDAATFSLQWDDRMFWGDRGADGLAGYIHGLAVSRAFAGRGLGGQVLRWTEGEIARRGRVFFRLDCMAENERLCAFYREQGLQDAGNATLPDRTYSFRLFEKRVAETLSS